MKTDIILAGVGGQGILSIAAAIGLAAIENNLFIKQAEVHGMSQRGGDVQSNLRISDKEIASDLIPFGNADIILAIEPMESLRYLPYLSRNGRIVTNSAPFINILDYPEIETVLDEIRKNPDNIIIDADIIAKNIGSPRSSNMVMLGAASHFINIKFESIENAVMKMFASKGNEVAEINVKALQAGREASKKMING
ncbi:MAG: indolepyruvate oxidoreductase subunit beta [Prevotellaceae bacterium]|jgi:indolepyruvate ferredoxin oxidoreductase beta subunit|nr:indolepyruvate oxidoreductase subunit beta [Prevotellaceae bacterium]